ncbi:MAG: nitrous oxide reductase family maturation protein NosD [Thermoplasmatota archaeon]
MRISWGTLCMVGAIWFMLFFRITPPVSSDDDVLTILQIREGIVIEGMEVSTPEGAAVEGNGSEEDPFVIASIWINNTGGPGIIINGSRSHVIIKDVIITYGIWNRSDGIFISNSTNITIVDSLVQNCYIGLHIDNTSSAQVVGSDLSGNRYGAIIRNSAGIDVTDCTLNGNLIDGILIETSDAVIVSFCQFVSNSARIANDAGIRVLRSPNTMIQGCEIRMNYGTGIYMSGPMSGCTVIDCDINYNNEGMVILDVRDLRVQGIEFIIDMKVMELEGLTNCTFSDITAYRNQDGLSLRDVDNCSFNRMEMEGCGYGILIEGSDWNVFTNNTFRGSRTFDLTVGSPHNFSLSSDGNDFYGNRFREDSWNLPSVHDHGRDNRWHKEGTGNLWSGWEMEDSDLDGIGDTPFRINGTSGSMDMFPRTDVERSIDPVPDDIDPVKDEDDRSGTHLLILLSLCLLSISILAALSLARGSRSG